MSKPLHNFQVGDIFVMTINLGSRKKSRLERVKFEVLELGSYPVQEKGPCYRGAKVKALDFNPREEEITIPDLTLCFAEKHISNES